MPIADRDGSSTPVRLIVTLGDDSFDGEGVYRQVRELLDVWMVARRSTDPQAQARINALAGAAKDTGDQLVESAKSHTPA